MRKFLLGGLLGLALPILSYGQVCTVDPLTGTSWAFSIHTPSGGVATIGNFKATNVGGQTISGVQTVNIYGQISRQESFAGRYTLDGDCRSGEILINVGRHSVQLQFYFSNGQTEMHFVNDGVNYMLPFEIVNMRRIFLRGDDLVFTGLARRLPAGSPSCGANTPLSTLNGKSFGFRTSNFGPNILQNVVAYPFDTAVAGIFDASSASGTGLLTITETINRENPFGGIPGFIFTPPGGFGIFRGIKTGGRYIVNSDCSGGEIMIMTNYQPIQYEFVFSGAGFNEMFLLSDSDGAMLQGVAKLY